MKGLMQDGPLVLTNLFDRAEKLFSEKEIVTATATGTERAVTGPHGLRVADTG